MLTYPRIGEVGRLGNQLFLVAFLTSFCERYGISYALPRWKYAQFFSYRFIQRDDLHTLHYDLGLSEPSLGYHEQGLLRHLAMMRAGNVQIKAGYFQSCKYFTKEHVVKVFKPLVPPVAPAGRCVAISVRRGDFVDHSYYNVIEAEAYLTLLDEYFPNRQVYVFTDDYDYCRTKFRGPQFVFPSELTDIGQLQLMACFNDFILSNSTFSYWGPMLSLQPHTVLYPRHMFPDPELCEVYNEHYWPKHPAYIPFDNVINKPRVVVPRR